MIRVRDLHLTYKSGTSQHRAVRGISFEIPQGQFYTLLGPSGCGKTTTLRCVAGLERPDTGEIVVGDEIVFSSERGINIAPHNRHIGMVFQSYAIWPHMSVFDNVAFPLRSMKHQPSRAEIRERVMKALALVQLNGLEKRQAPMLSGGQQQRLALARAMVAEPRVLLLDEPLSNLDAKLREDMRLEVRELVKRLKMTTLFVTHEQVEALTMSDTIAVMNAGEIVQQGSPLEIYMNPKAVFIADFIGKTNCLKATVSSLDRADGSVLTHLDTPIGKLVCRQSVTDRIGETVSVAVRPENVAFLANGTGQGVQNVVVGDVEAVAYLGNFLDCTVKVRETLVRVQLHPSSALRAGDKVTLSLPAEHCLVMPS